MPLPRRDPAADSHVKSIVDNTVHNGLRHGAVTLGVRIYSSVLAFGFVLSTEYHGTIRLLSTSGLHNLKPIVRFLWGKAADKPLINNEQIHFLVSFLSCIFSAAFATRCTPGNVQLIQQFWHTNVQNGLNLRQAEFPNAQAM